jgi:hypothetical protein
MVDPPPRAVNLIPSHLYSPQSIARIITAILVHTTHITLLSLFYGISLLYFGLAGHT